MIRVIRRFLVAKLALVVLTAVLLGMAGTAAVNSHMQLRSMERMQEESASSLALSLAAGVRNAMLTGNGSAVRELLADAKKNLMKARIQVYAADGAEVFGDKPPAPPPDKQPVHVRAALESNAVADGPDGAKGYPIENAKRCQKCHEDQPLRGVLTLAVRGAEVAWAGEGAQMVLAQTARAAFVQIMTGRREFRVDDYFEELAERTPGVEAVSVFTSDGEQFFGDDDLEIPEPIMARALSKGPPFSVEHEGKVLRMVPLENEPRCQGCHEADEAMRGALAMAIDEGALAGEKSLVEASITSLEHVMLAGLGRLIQAFLDEVAATRVVSKLALHDQEGRLYHDAFTDPVPPLLVGDALLKAAPQMQALDDPERHEFHYVDPLVNEKRCQTCHGTDRQLRGAISVSLDTTEAAAERSELQTRSTLFAGVTIALVVFLLWWGLGFTVLRPVREIGSVADKIGEGELDVHVDLSTIDEMGRLAQRINEMVNGLRQKLELAKFVSKATLETVEDQGTVDRGGERRCITVLFSDIRGFTAYSETREPEEVVDMLNTYLQVQADVVHKFGGDIDKFVGDELMARFDGEEHALNAVQAAVEMIAAVRATNAIRHDGDSMAVGVGINTGTMVLGAMGSVERMDFTVIGDAVNLGARLCSAAGPHEVIVSDATAQRVGEVAGCYLQPLEPISVKGKSDPIRIYKAVPHEHPTTRPTLTADQEAKTIDGASPLRRGTVAYFETPFQTPSSRPGSEAPTARHTPAGAHSAPTAPHPPPRSPTSDPGPGDVADHAGPGDGADDPGPGDGEA